jgi:hypothetical protein
MNYNEVADVIERFVNGTAGPLEWDNCFLGTRYEDPFLRQIQERALAVSFEFPPGPSGGYTSAEGLEVLRELAEALRSQPRPPAHL